MARRTIPLDYRQHTCGGFVGAWRFTARAQGGGRREYLRFYALEDPLRRVTDCPHCGQALAMAELCVPEGGLASFIDPQTGKLLPAARKEDVP